MSEPFRKDPDVDKSFGVNWAPNLGALTITASVWEPPSGITIIDDSNTTTTTSAIFSGGTDGEDYEVLNRITKSNNETEDTTILIQVREASWRLTEDEIVTIAEISKETYGTINDAAGSLNANQVAAIRDDLTLWATIRNSFVTYKDKADFDNERKRAAIRERIRRALGLSLIYDDGAGASMSVNTVPVW